MSEGVLAPAFKVEHEAWMDEGACKKEKANPKYFIMDQGLTAHKGKAYCDRCGVKEQCLAYARRTGSVGVWGGVLFTFRDEDLEWQLQDARPHNVIPMRLSTPGILGGAAMNFSKPGILGG